MTLQELKKELRELYETKKVLCSNERGASCVQEIRHDAMIEAGILEYVLKLLEEVKK